jgi:hypothetical protein
MPLPGRTRRISSSRAIFPSDTSCGLTGCWKYMKIDTTPGSATFGALIPDMSLLSFQGCEVPTGTTCPSGTRRITHFQLKVNYEHRLWHNSSLIPPGLPSGTASLPPTIAAGTWKHCGANPSCP